MVDKGCQESLDGVKEIGGCDKIKLETMNFLYNRCPRNVLEVAMYLKEKYEDTDLEYSDFLVIPPEPNEGDPEESRGATGEDK